MTGRTVRRRVDCVSKRNAFSFALRRRTPFDQTTKRSPILLETGVPYTKLTQLTTTIIMPFHARYRYPRCEGTPSMLMCQPFQSGGGGATAGLNNSQRGPVRVWTHVDLH